MSKFVWVVLVLAVGSCSAIPDPLSGCKSNSVKETVKCVDLGASVPIGGGLYSGWEFLYNPLFSVYYGARVAEALGYDSKCTNRTFLAEMDLMTSWSGKFGTIGIDGAFGYDRVYPRRCKFPSPQYPFLCTGSSGGPHTDGKKLGTLSYISLLQDDENNDWTLFGHCWDAKTSKHPTRKETATSWNVFSRKPTLSAEDFANIKGKLEAVGFSTSDADLIQPNYTS